MGVLTPREFSYLRPPKIYVVEIEGEPRLVCGIFIEALKAGREFKQKFPHSHIKVHDADDA